MGMLGKKFADINIILVPFLCAVSGVVFVNVLLVKPPQPSSAIFHILPPLGLGYLASSVRKNGTSVRIVDCLCDNISYKKLMGIINTARPDIVGLTMMSYDMEMVRLITRAIKNEISKDIVTVVGGAHPSAAPRHTLEELRNVDFAFKGEAEAGFPLLIEFVKNHYHGGLQKLAQIPGLVFRQDNDIKINPQAFVEDLDRFGFPDWELINPRKYFRTAQGVFNKEQKFTSLFATRGCPHSCAFCAAHNINGKRIRKRSAAHIIKEMEYLQDKYGIQEFHFLDDNFTSDNNFAAEFCDEIAKHKMRVSWACPNGVRIDSLNEPLLRKMKDAGCYALFVGIESGSQTTLDRVQKGLKINDIVDKVHLIKKTGFFLTAFFMLGLPGEGEDEMEETIQFACSLPIDIADFSNFLPVPGAAILNAHDDRNTSPVIDYTRMSSPAYVTNDARKTEEKDIQRKMIRRAYLKFYTRPRVLFRSLRRIRSPQQIYFLLKRVYEYVVRNNN